MMQIARWLQAGLLAATLAVPIAAERRGSLGQDECGRRSAECERRCDSLQGMDRLSCKTDCRMQASQCRANKK